MTTVKELAGKRSVFTIEKDLSVRAATEYMAEKNIGALPVTEGDRLVGIFSERDVVNRVVSRGLDPTVTPVSRVMTTELVVATADETCESCLRKMKQANCRHLPVVEGDKLIAFISLRDLLLVDISEKDDTIQFLNTYMFHIPTGVEKRYAK